MIDSGFWVATLAAMIVTLACTENHLRAAWRICLGLAVIPPLSLIYLRIKLKEPEAYARNKMRKYPFWLIFKMYGFRLFIVSLIWFLYDFSSYSFSIYSTTWLAYLLPADAPLWKTFGWGTVINLFYIPGSFAGAFVSDWIGPKYCLALGVILQGIVGFIMSGLYGYLDHASRVVSLSLQESLDIADMSQGGFVVVYGIFLSLGELGPGDNIGLVAAKTCASPIRGQYYAIAAAIGKIGAFVGTYVFPDIIAAGGSSKIKMGQYPFFVSSALCLFSGLITLLFIPNIKQDTIDVCFPERRVPLSR